MLDNYLCVPFSQDDVNKLVNDLGFPDRFFVGMITRRLLSARTTTGTSDCWLMHDWLFHGVTLQITRNDDLLSIIVSSGGKAKTYANIKLFTHRYISSKFYSRHSLFPILLFADAALENYRDAINNHLAQSWEDSRLLGEFNKHNRLSTGQQDSAAKLTWVARQREQVTQVSCDLKDFHASVRNLLNLHDGSAASSGPPAPPQPISDQYGGQTIPILSLVSMGQYLVSSSSDILEKVAGIDIKLQNNFLVVRFRDPQDRISDLWY
jgi:hypothetical protein